MPYNGTPEQIEHRMTDVFVRVVKQIYGRGDVAISPLFNHFLLPYTKLPTDWQFWRQSAISMMASVDEMWVVAIEGWDKSVGVDGEIEISIAMNVPFLFVTEQQIADNQLPINIARCEQCKSTMRTHWNVFQPGCIMHRRSQFCCVRCMNEWMDEH